MVRGHRAFVEALVAWPTIDAPAHLVPFVVEVVDYEVSNPLGEGFECRHF